jgi:4-hydroxy-3-methylbut-2-enyl diphosphate reductase
MLVYKLEPHSYCEGVVRAFLEAKKAEKEHPGEPITLIGSLVHNEEAVSRLRQEGFAIVDEREADLGRALSSLPKGSVIVFSAHGHPEKFDEIAKERCFVIYDATCSFVRSNLALAREEKAQGHDVIYLGEKGHLEAMSAIANCPWMRFLDAKDMGSFDAASIKDASPSLISQTTMSELDVEQAISFLRKDFPGVRYAGGRCPSTIARQKAIENAPAADLFVVLGSATSNNTNKLVRIAETAHPQAKVIRAVSADELRGMDLSPYSSCVLATGASTSPQAYDEALAYLESL